MRFLRTLSFQETRKGYFHIFIPVEEQIKLQSSCCACLLKFVFKHKLISARVNFLVSPYCKINFIGNT